MPQFAHCTICPDFCPRCAGGRRDCHRRLTIMTISARAIKMRRVRIDIDDAVASVCGKAAESCQGIVILPELLREGTALK